MPLHLELLVDGRPYEPLPHQAAFHASPHTHRAIVGGMGSGKTKALVVEVIHTAIEYPGTEIVLARQNYKRLQMTTWKELINILPPQLIAPGGRYESPQNLSVILKNGTIIHGMNLANWEAFTSLELGLVAIDEASELQDPNVFLQLDGRLRNKKGPMKSILVGTPAGKDWLYERFVGDQDPGQYTITNGDHFLVHPVTKQNPYLPPDYEARLRRQHPAAWVDRFLEGAWDAFEGQILPGFGDLHLVDRFHAPDSWSFYLGMDHGGSNLENDPTAALIVAMDPEENLVVCDAYRESGRVISQNSAAIREMIGRRQLEWSVIDPSTDRDDPQTRKSILEMYADEGLRCQKGVNSVMPSISKILQLLQPDPARRFPQWHHRAGELGAPRLFVMRHLTPLIDELKGWRWRQHRSGGYFKPEPRDGQDDLVASLRYVIMSQPVSVHRLAPESGYQRMLRRMDEMFGTPEPDDGALWIGNDKAKFPAPHRF